MSAATHGLIRAVLLAAGQGKRMKSSRPKVLHEVLGRPIISRVLDALDELSLEHIHVIVGHGGDQVQQFLEANPPETSWSVNEQKPQLGTGHALQQLVPELGDFNGTLLVTVSDTPLLTSATLDSLIESHRQHNSVITLVTAKLDDAGIYGRIVRDRSGKIVKIVEAADASCEQKSIGEINTGIYCFEWPDIEDGLSSLTNDNKQNEYYLTDLVAWAAGKDRTISSITTGNWHEVSGVNSRLDLAFADHLLRDCTLERLSLEDGVTIIDPNSTWIAPEVTIGQDTVVRPGCFLMGKIEIGSGCLIGPNTVMHGPVKVGDRTSVLQSLVVKSEIGSDCRVGPFANLHDGAVLSDAVRIGNFVEIKKSSIGAKTNVAHLSYVGDAEVGSQVNLGAGTLTANYNRITKVKSRTVIGDGASTGCNSVLVAPVALGNDATVAACTVVTKDVPAGALAVGRARQENKFGWVESKRKLLEPAE